MVWLCTSTMSLSSPLSSPSLCYHAVVWPFPSPFFHTWVSVTRWGRCNYEFKHVFFISPSGWNKTSLSLDASEEHDGYSSAEDPLHSDAEDDAGKKLVSGSLCLLIAENQIPGLSQPSCRTSLNVLLFYISVRFVQCAGKYTAKADYEKAGAQELMVKSGEMVELIKQEDDGLW